MYAVVRTYSGKGASELFDLLGQREEDVKALISGVPGFVSYVAVRGGAGGATVTVCEDKEGTEESSRRAAAWVKPARHRHRTCGRARLTGRASSRLTSSTMSVRSARLEGDRVTVRLSLKEPPRDAILTQALTYPYAVAVIRDLSPEGKAFSFADQRGRELDWPVRRAGG